MICRTWAGGMPVDSKGSGGSAGKCQCGCQGSFRSASGTGLAFTANSADLIQTGATISGTASLLTAKFITSNESICSACHCAAVYSRPAGLSPQSMC